jgi:hypothetical protein
VQSEDQKPTIASANQNALPTNGARHTVTTATSHNFKRHGMAVASLSKQGRQLSNQVGGPVAYSNNRAACWGIADRFLRDASTDSVGDRADKQRRDLT